VSALETAGLQVDTAVDGQEGLDRATADTAAYDAILMDLQMPNMDGLQATRRIRAVDGDTPIIGVTANALSDTREQCMQAGMNEVVTKPIHMELLFTTMIRAVGENFAPATDAAPNTDAAASVLPGIEGIDVADGLARSGGNAELYTDLLRRFATGHADSVTAIRESLDSGDREAAERVVHTLKGVSGNIGAREVFDISSRLREVMKGTDEAKMAELVDELDRVLSGLVATIASVVADSNAVNEASAAKPEDFARLLELARDSDVEALELFASLRAGLDEAWGPATADEVAAALNGYDFEHAVELIEATGAP
jgi:CheY-like chemotaxis protein